MSSHTSTTTTFGTIHAYTHDDGTRSIESVCKVCGRTTTQPLQPGENAFIAAKPEHAVGCRFHPNTPRPTPAPPAPLPRPLTRTATAASSQTWCCDPTLRWLLAAILVAEVIGLFF